MRGTRSDFARPLFCSADRWGCEDCSSALSASKLRAVPAKIEPVAIACWGKTRFYGGAQNQANDLAPPLEGRRQTLRTPADDFCSAQRLRRGGIVGCDVRLATYNHRTNQACNLQPTDA